MSRLYSLQILRAVAAILVVFTHIAGFVKTYDSDFIVNKYVHFLGTGSLGVYIFFIVSGVVMYLISGNYKDRESDFLFKRFWRILPIYYIYTALFIAVEPFYSKKAILKTLTFIDFSKTDLVLPLLPVGWTLSFELYFYFLIFAGLKFFGKDCIKGVSIALVCLILIGFLPIELTFFKFLTSPLLLYFLIGLWAIPLIQKVKFSATFGAVCIFLFLACLLTIYAIGYYNYGEQVACNIDELWNRVLIFGIPSTLIVFGALVIEKSINLKNWLYKFLYDIGDASYTLYLTHYILMQAFLKVFNVLHLNTWFFFIGGIIIPIWVSLYLYKLIEKPLLEKQNDVKAFLKAKLLPLETNLRRIPQYHTENPDRI